jgi:hypothetical protein
VVGSFNNWNLEDAVPLTKSSPHDVFEATIALPEGTYEYKFIIDGHRWCYDIMNATKADNRGNRNNFIVVGRPSHGGAAKVPLPVPVQVPVQVPVKEAESHAPAVEKPEGGRENKKEKQQQQQQQKGQQQKGQQQKGEQQQQKQKGQQKKDTKEIENAAKKTIMEVNSYSAAWYVSDVAIEDSLEDVMQVVKIFSEAVPETACLFFSSGVKTLIVAATVPESKIKDFPAIEWLNIALSVVPGQPKGEGDEKLAHAVVQANPDLGIFPLKLKDQARGAVFPVLRKKGLIKEEEDDDDDVPMSFDDI